MQALYFENHNIPILDNGKKLTDYQIERIDGNYIFIKHLEYQGVLYLDGKNSRTSEIISPNKFRIINNFDENGCAIAHTAFNQYLIKSDGSICSDPYAEINYLGKGVYWCKISNSRSSNIIDNNGRIIVSKFSYVELLGNNLKLHRETSGSFWYNLDDHKIYDKSYYSVDSIVGDKIIGYDHGLNGMTDEHNNEIIKCKYATLLIIDENRLLVQSRFGNWKIIDYQENLITNVPSLRKEDYNVEKFDTNFGLIREPKGLKVGLVKLDGNIMVQPKYEFITKFHNGRAIVSKNLSLYNLINEDGKELLKNDYCFMHYVSGDVYIAELTTSNWMLINSNEQRINKKYYNYMCKINDFLVEVGSLQKGVIDIQGNEIIEPVHNQIKYLKEDNLVLAYTSDEIIIYQITENTLIRLCQVSNKCRISTKGNLILINGGSRYCIINRQGKPLVDYIDADSVFIVNDNYVIIDNVLINIANIDIKYNLNCYFDGELYIKQYYNNSEDRKKDNQLLETKINEMLEKAGFEKTIEKPKEKKLRIQ